ncbi:hypothetical protein F383_12053 [Gossypium arboreum]|uniref:Uncharacterized protein n=1 Tax=Gossypium arboreum TaxID=29729 RepID=A0A0B0Q0E0_GOSAR|nr:hypothetical protein F383_12053 [Gossypium arboreum]
MASAPIYESQCKTMSGTWHQHLTLLYVASRVSIYYSNRVAKLASGIKGHQRHRSHCHLKFLCHVGVSKGGKKAW